MRHTTAFACQINPPADLRSVWAFRSGARSDEPTSALDVTVQIEVLRILDRLVTDRGAGLIFISHDLRLVSSFCDRVLVMMQGGWRRN